jgi:hypothetical protein
VKLLRHEGCEKLLPNGDSLFVWCFSHFTPSVDALTLKRCKNANGLNSALISSLRQSEKKADAAEHPQVFHRVGLLTNETLGRAGFLFIQSSVFVERRDLNSLIATERILRHLDGIARRVSLEFKITCVLQLPQATLAFGEFGQPILTT